MTAKTFWITAVDPPHNSPITKVCAFETTQQADGSWSLGQIKPYTRLQLVAGLQQGTAILWTATWNDTKRVWTRGAEVKLTKKGPYITTEPNDETRDNLGNLPACNC